MPPTTRFAPAPTGYLHLGHVADAIHVWGIARATGGRVILRIEDHDRQRCRPEYETALLDDLEWLGLAPDAPPIPTLRSGAPSPWRQRDRDGLYRAAARGLAAGGRLYACRCSRSDVDRWAAEHGRPWSGAGCPRDCRTSAAVDEAGLDAFLDASLAEDPPMAADAPRRSLRAWIGDGTEAFTDLALGEQAGPVAPGGDPPVRDRHGNWSYGFAVVVDDADQAIDLVIRGRDLLEATPGQIRLARVLGRRTPPAFLHHPLVLKPGGAKLSKADGDSGIRDLRAAGRSVPSILGAAAAAVGLSTEGGGVEVSSLAGLFTSLADRLARGPGSS